MLIVRGIGAGVVPYYMGREHPGVWSDGAGRLFGLIGAVEGAPLRQLLLGRHPGTSRYLPARRPARRRGGWDLVFAAPKSVSILAAAADPAGAAAIRSAHGDALRSVMALLEGQARLRVGAPDGGMVAAEGLVAASFQHDTNSAGAPHLHSHVLVANLSRAAGTWGPLVPPSWYVSRPALAALYQLDLRHQMERRGWDLEWRLRPDGLADLAGTPRASVRAASIPARIPARTAAGSSRSGPPVPPAPPLPPVPASSPAPTGRWLAPEAGRRTAGSADSGLEDPRLERAVALRLTVRRSDFRLEDVVIALAACHAGGAGVWDAVGWATRFCERSRPVPSPTVNPRWTTAAARRSDDELLDRLRRAGRPDGHRTTVPEPAPTPIPGDGPDPSVAAAAQQLTGGDAPVQFLSGPPGHSTLLAQAEVVQAAAEMWHQAGLTVGVDSPSREAARRWEVLTGIGAPPAGPALDVLVVDQADRRTTSELSRLVERHRGRLLLFVEGGTLPRLTNPASHGLREAADRAGRQLPPPHPTWEAGTAPGPTGPLIGRQAAAALLAAWQSHGCEALLVGLGLEEARGLNRAAARLLAGPTGDSGEPDSLRPGHRVMVVKHRSGLPPVGTMGEVVDAVARRGRRPSTLVVSWADGSVGSVTGAWTAGAVGLGYATTATLARCGAGPLMVLGPAEAVGRQRRRVVAEVARPAGPLELARGRGAGRSHLP